MIRFVRGRSFHGAAAAVVFSAAAAGLAGCGDARPVSPIPAGVTAEHGGNIIPLPDGSGFVEVSVASDGKGKGANARGRVVASFRNKDGSGPPETAPTAVSFAQGGKTYPLASKPDSTTKGARFETEIGPFLATQDLNGELSATLGSGAVKFPLVTR